MYQIAGGFDRHECRQHEKMYDINYIVLYFGAKKHCFCKKYIYR